MERILKPLVDYLQDGDMDSSMGALIVVGLMAVYYALWGYTRKSSQEKTEDAQRKKFIKDVQKLAKKNAKAEDDFLKAMEGVKNAKKVDKNGSD